MLHYIYSYIRDDIMNTNDVLIKIGIHSGESI